MEEKYSGGKLLLNREAYTLSFLTNLEQWNLFLNPSPKEYVPQTRVFQWPFQISKIGGWFIFNWGSYYKSG